jgi:hypothetical protein
VLGAEVPSPGQDCCHKVNVGVLKVVVLCSGVKTRHSFLVRSTVKTLLCL